MDDSKRYITAANPCAVGPKYIVVQQVVGSNTRQKAIDVHICVPRRKPAIEQIIDVFVKDVKITCVDAALDKVIVRGCFEIKAIYVACLPAQPVHAVEMRYVKFTVDVPVYGACRGMRVDASVRLEYVESIAIMGLIQKLRREGRCLVPWLLNRQILDCEKSNDSSGLAGCFSL